MQRVHCNHLASRLLGRLEGRLGTLAGLMVALL